MVTALLEGPFVLELNRRIGIRIILALSLISCAAAQQTATSGTFMLHKFAQTIGNETYSIDTKDDTYALTSHFLFTDRGTKVPLDTTFVARIDRMTPLSYAAKGRQLVSPIWMTR